MVVVAMMPVVCVQMYGLILLTELPSKLDRFDVLTLMLSAICHDLDHPGYNNTYQVLVVVVVVVVVLMVAAAAVYPSTQRIYSL